jgi:hypothetical protein
VRCGSSARYGATHVRSHFPQAASRVWALTQETCETAVLLATHLGHFPQAASRVWALTQETCETAVLRTFGATFLKPLLACGH